MVTIISFPFFENCLFINEDRMSKSIAIKKVAIIISKILINKDGNEDAILDKEPTNDKEKLVICVPKALTNW